MGSDTLLKNQLKVVVFDTSCILCSRFVKILLKNDRGVLRYTGFESRYAKENLPASLINDPDTVVFYKQGKVLFRSTAVIAILAELRFPYRILKYFKYLPLTFRDSMYNLIARKRYGWFGKSDTCFLPTSDQKLQFLD